MRFDSADLAGSVGVFSEWRVSSAGLREYAVNPTGQASRIMMKKKVFVGCFLVGALRTALCGFVPHVSGDSDLIQSSPHQAYYRISIDSKKWWAWGLGGAPVEEPSQQNRGYGWDAIAIPFDARGRVEFAPVYIYTIIPEAFEEARLRRLYEGITTMADVLSLYGSVREVRHVSGYEVWYYRIRVWNPAEELPSGGPSN